MRGSRIDSPDRPPAAASGSWVFGLGSAAFLIALVVAGISMATESTPSERAPIPPILARGEAIFDGEGCIACHSRMVRPRDRGMGPAASSSALMGDSSGPGSSRLGPDLQNLAGRYPPSLLEIRLKDPRALQPETLMPSYSHLSPADKSALIAYLEKPLTGPTGWEAVRARNRIEPAVPDALLASLSEYVDPDTAVIVFPIQQTPEFTITGRGLFNARCAACHGISGKGDGPASWREWGQGAGEIAKTAPIVPPADFTQPRFDAYSPVMWYWRIKEGVPGTEMPAWDGSLSEDALWFLVGYVRTLAADASPRPAKEESPKENHEAAEQFDESDTLTPPAPPEAPPGDGEEASHQDTQPDSIPAESASEEEGA